MRLSDEDCTRLRRFAFQIACQLPDDKQEALHALEYTRQLVEWRDIPAPKPTLHVAKIG